MTTQFLADDIIAKQAAREARARWQDARNPTVFYRRERPGEAHGCYSCQWNAEKQRLSLWQQTPNHYPPESAVMI